MFRSILRSRLFGPLQMSRFLFFLPQFVRLFYRLFNDSRVPGLVKMVPFLGVLLLLTPPALELDLIPVVGELDWILVGYIALKVFIWLCPPDVVREHVDQIAHGV